MTFLFSSSSFSRINEQIGKLFFMERESYYKIRLSIL